MCFWPNWAPGPEFDTTALRRLSAQENTVLSTRLVPNPAFLFSGLFIEFEFCCEDIGSSLNEYK